ncbi:MAG: putative sulfate exporter family transporter [Cyanobacteria bacterium]|nr:putative sulfate exporter family transporter [Cyanobacteriota bacterium]
MTSSLARREWVAPLLRTLPGTLAALSVMLSGFWLADIIGQQILRAQGLVGSGPLSGVPVAIVIGLLLRHTGALDASFNPGLKFATTTGLKAGIVIAGIRLSLFDVLKPGVAGLPVVLAAITVGLSFVVWFNRRLGLPPRRGFVIAAGTSICGVTAIVSSRLRDRNNSVTLREPVAPAFVA